MCASVAEMRCLGKGKVAGVGEFEVMRFRLGTIHVCCLKPDEGCARAHVSVLHTPYLLYQ